MVGSKSEQQTSSAAMTTPAWVGKLLHELLVFMAARGMRLPPADIDALRNLLRRSIGAHVEPIDQDAETPTARPPEPETDPGWKGPSRKRRDVLKIPRKPWP